MSEDFSWEPFLRENASKFKFHNGLPVEELLTDILLWVNSSKKRQEAKYKYQQFVVRSILEGMVDEKSFKKFLNDLNRLSAKLKKPIPDKVKNKILAYSL